jgi:hypothetical protein
MGRKIDAEKLIEDMRRRIKTLEEDDEHFNSAIGESVRVGAIMCLNETIDIVEKMAKIK